MKPLRVDITEQEFEAETPQVQEALWRLARRQTGPEDQRLPSERLRDSTKKAETAAQFARKVNQFIKPDGLSIREKPSIAPPKSRP